MKNLSLFPMKINIAFMCVVGSPLKFYCQKNRVEIRIEFPFSSSFFQMPRSSRKHFYELWRPSLLRYMGRKQFFIIQLSKLDLGFGWK
jgi:hypothetical protein